MPVTQSGLCISRSLTTQPTDSLVVSTHRPSSYSHRTLQVRHRTMWMVIFKFICSILKICEDQLIHKHCISLVQTSALTPKLCTNVHLRTFDFSHCHSAMHSAVHQNNNRVQHTLELFANCSMNGVRRVVQTAVCSKAVCSKAVCSKAVCSKAVYLKAVGSKAMC